MTRAEYYKQWREKNKERLREEGKKYYEANKEKISEQAKAYYLANREEIIGRVKKNYDANPQPTIDRANEWNAANPERRKEILKKWSQEHKESVNECCRKHRERHPDFHKKRLAEWRKRNPLLVKFYTQQRRARIAGSEGTITPEQVGQLYEKQGGKCAACKKVLNMLYHLDHVMPLALGGQHVIENAEILCAKCNQKKHASHPDDWAARLGKLFV